MLKKPQTTFEADDNIQDAEVISETQASNATAKAAAAETTNSKPSQVDVAKTSATLAVAAASAGTGLAKVGSKFVEAFTAQQNQFDPTSLDYDTFPRITVGLDGFSDTDSKEYGKEIVLQILSWNEHYSVSPGGAVNPETTKLLKYSLDGKTIDETGQPVAEYLAFLRDVEGYPEASVKKYISLYGTVEGGDYDGHMVSVQIPPRSVPKFQGHRIAQGVAISRGKAEADERVKLTQVKVDGKSAKYAAILFSAP